MILSFMSSKSRRRLGAAIAFILAGTIAAFATPRHIEMPEDGWTTYKSEAFGYRLYYPSAYFEPQAIAAPGEPKTFISPDGQAKIVVWGAENSEGQTPASYRAALVKDSDGYDSIDYASKGETWFVLSGYRGAKIFYQKVMFSCGNRIINVFSVAFPSAEKSFYEGLIEVMEDNFRPGRGADTPIRCTY